jgi:YcaO-like protein with predicted kinase domain
LLHEGMGAHPDPDVALERALTEAAQSRAADIQGSREDLDYWRRRAGTWDGTSDVWGLRPAATLSRAAACEGARHSDIREDIQWMAARLADAGLPRAYVVDLTHPAIGIPVVRVVVPGLEFTAIDEYRVGPRVRRAAAEAKERCPA